MADGISADFSDITKLAADLTAAGTTAVPFVRKAVEVTARHIKEDWRKSLDGSGWVPHGASAISYDMKPAPESVEAEIGPELKGQGPIVGMLEYGVPEVVAPTGYGHAALQKNEGDFVHGLAEALKDAGI